VQPEQPGTFRPARLGGGVLCPGPLGRSLGITPTAPFVTTAVATGRSVQDENHHRENPSRKQGDALPVVELIPRVEIGQSDRGERG
jgi:hypothetical protein